MEYSSPFASGSSPRGDASDHPEGVSKEAPYEGASGHPAKILKTEELPKKLPKILKISEKDVEIIVDEEDIRIKLGDAIIKILYNSSGLKEILIDDEVVYQGRCW